jgi:hypothetical protein
MRLIIRFSFLSSVEEMTGSKADATATMIRVAFFPGPASRFTGHSGHLA